MADSHSIPPPGNAHHHLSHLHHHHHHHHMRRHRMPSGGEDQGEDEELDPRIQVELEKLNKASEEINRLELELDDARAAFRQVLSDSTQRLNGLAKKLGTCVDKARPYYEARMRLKEAHLESQKAALRFERACSMHEAAKEMVQLAEEGYKRREQDLDPTWQEMLNHATMKVNDAERERIESEDCHQQTTVSFKKRDEEVQKLQKDLKRAITKSKPYFEMKAKFNQVMEDHKRSVSRLEDDVGSAKALYSQALRSLEAISDDIHRQRLERQQQLQLGVRGAGVGAEAPSPPHTWEKGANIDGSAEMCVYDSGEEDSEGPLNSSVGSSDRGRTGMEMNSRSEGKGIVRHELPYRKRTSVSDLSGGHFRSDPLNVVLFKTSTPDVPASKSPPGETSSSFQPPSIIHTDRTRRPSYQSAIDASQEAEQAGSFTLSHDDSSGKGLQRTDADSTLTQTPNPEFVSTSLPSRFSAAAASCQQGPDVASTLLSSSKGSPHGDFELSGETSLSRAQEWVNKSPIPQQRRFVKSKSLIGSSSSPGMTVESPIDMDLSATISAELMRGAVGCDGTPAPGVPTQVVLTSSSSSVSPQQRTSPVNISISSMPGDKVQLASPHLPSQGSTPERSSPLSGGSPSLHRKSPKLQGLILRVDAGGFSSSSSPAPSSSHVAATVCDKPAPSGPPHLDPAQKPKVVISTQHPSLGVFTEKQAGPAPSSSSHQQLSQDSCSLSYPQRNPAALVGYPPASVAPLSSSSSIPTSCPKPPTSLITKLKNSTTSRISSYDSKTAPSTLSTSYRLPSTSRQKLSPLAQPPTTQPSPSRAPNSPGHFSTSIGFRHPLKSPTPPSPSADRFSLTGRSDSLSASSGHKAALLKVPSENSSDTESIASTGPMLDDDQVEFLTLDFNEQSIACDTSGDPEEPDYEPMNTGALRRGNWARMSLPPRLSYLEGFLERTRHLSGGGVGVSPEDEEGSGVAEDGCRGNQEEDSRSSVVDSGGDFQDKLNDFQDDETEECEVIEEGYQAGDDDGIVDAGDETLVSPDEDCVGNSSTRMVISSVKSREGSADIDVEVDIQICLDVANENIVSQEENGQAEEENDLRAETDADGTIHVVEGSTVIGGEDEDCSEENVELFV
ncbi:uncharacterized protein LOC101846373 [Aplysia californica]|uniref:SH3 domain-binding protein 5-like n=1 Tax=Aplysia californica TaxID=6500 RepID=A0ABM0JYQ3_APLCA|nr:uncharacterized protein LOC101846373 [Aplysia californica]XP_035827293.1 uncharacterized protein LOC101846373 [Aplysia californica]